MTSAESTRDTAGPAAQRAVYVVFIMCGVAFASWASRIPQVRDELDVSSSVLGLILLSIAVGSLLALPTAGLLVDRFGAALVVRFSSLLCAAGLATVALGYREGIAPVVVGLFLTGFGVGTWDVGMNVHGAVVEQRLDRSVMPRFHAGYSVGTVIGALVGTEMVALGVSPRGHLLVVAVLVALVVPVTTRGFLAAVPAQEHDEATVRRSPLAAWREPRTLLIGVFVLCMAFTEGTGVDWLGVAMIDGYEASATIGSLTLALFVSAMTLARWFGTGLVERFGRVLVLRGSAALALVGLMLIVFGAVLPVALLGSVLFGLGAALGFPLGMSAAADEPQYAPGRVSVVASIGYTAFLAGPPLIGFLGDRVGVLRALTVAAGMLALALMVTAATRAPAPIAAEQPSRT